MSDAVAEPGIGRFVSPDSVWSHIAVSRSGQIASFSVKLSQLSVPPGLRPVGFRSIFRPQGHAHGQGAYAASATPPSMDLRPANFVECCLLIDKAVPSIEIGIAKREDPIACKRLNPRLEKPPLLCL